MLQPILNKNDNKAKWLIGIVSFVVFAAVTILGKYNLAGKVQFSFDVHVFALINTIINATVTLLLIVGLLTVKQKKYQLHKNIMMTAMVLSVLFLVSYICHHLFAGETAFGGTGIIRKIYFLILFTHIPLAGLVLPFILFAAYRALTGEYAQHKKLVRYVWPVWFYVAITGVVVYLMISPYYK
jgi:putative membrane protein